MNPPLPLSRWSVAMHFSPGYAGSALRSGFPPFPPEFKLSKAKWRNQIWLNAC